MWGDPSHGCMEEGIPGWTSDYCNEEDIVDSIQRRGCILRVLDLAFLVFRQIMHCIADDDREIKKNVCPPSKSCKLPQSLIWSAGDVTLIVLIVSCSEKFILKKSHVF